MALEEIVANKMKCLIQRRHSHDLFDLVYATFIDRSIEIDRSAVLQTFLKKTIFGASPGAAKEILLGIPMAFFSGVWEKFIRCPKSTRFNFERASEGFRDSIERLFEGVQMNNWGERMFFPSVYRNLIMEAGAERKLLRLTYGGIERLVEPYALSYKRPAGKPAQEYFYIYDQTGGSSSGPGMKSLVNSGVDKIEITDQLYEPRYEIELSKAGEEARKNYFGKDFSSKSTTRGLQALTNRSRKPARFKGFQQKYKVQCPYCQKIFTRSTQSLDLKEHKSPNGYRCGGRRGYRVF